MAIKKKPLSIERRMVIASATVSSEKNTIHSFSDVDIVEARRLIKKYNIESGVKLSFTGYVVKCLSETIEEYPEFNSFIKRKKLIILDDIIISVLVEREIKNEKVPEPLVIESTQNKSLIQISDEIREAQRVKSDKIGSLSNSNWFNLIPGFMLKTAVRIADKNIKIAKRYGKIAVTAVGMNSKQPLWFIPHGTGTLMLTIGSIGKKVVEIDGQFESREHLCITTSFDHDIIDGAPAARFMNSFLEKVKSGTILKNLIDGKI